MKKSQSTHFNIANRPPLTPQADSRHRISHAQADQVGFPRSDVRQLSDVLVPLPVLRNF